MFQPTESETCLVNTAAIFAGVLIELTLEITVLFIFALEQFRIVRSKLYGHNFGANMRYLQFFKKYFSTFSIAITAEHSPFRRLSNVEKYYMVDVK